MELTRFDEETFVTKNKEKEQKKEKVLAVEALVDMKQLSEELAQYLQKQEIQKDKIQEQKREEQKIAEENNVLPLAAKEVKNGILDKATEKLLADGLTKMIKSEYGQRGLTLAQKYLTKGWQAAKKLAQKAYPIVVTGIKKLVFKV